MINPPSGGGDELVVCAACGAENRAHSRFCERCGTRLPQPLQGAAPEERPTGAANPQPEAREDATVAFERPPLEPFPARDDPVASAAPLVPLAAPASGESPARDDRTDEPPANVAGPVQEAPAVAAHEDISPIRNAPTMSFDLPKLPISASIEPVEPVEPAGGPLPPSARDAPTMSFDLPPSSPSSEGVADAVGPADPIPTPTARTDQGQGPEGSWNYQSWKPLAPGEQGLVAEEPSDGTRRLAAVPSPAPASAWPEPVVVPGPTPVEPPQRQPEGYQSSPPQWYGPPSAPWGPGASVTYPTPGAGQQAGAPPTAPARAEAVAPASPYPAQPYDQTRGAAPHDPTRVGTPYGGAAAAAGPYPAPAATNNNRTLWIVLGVLGGVLFLCLAGCLLIVLLTGVVGASSSVGVATRVATVTRP